MKVKRGYLITAGVTVVILVILVVILKKVFITFVEESAQEMPLYLATVRNDLDEMKMLIEEGRDVNERGIAGHTPLITAVRSNYLEAAKLLLENEANPNIKDDIGWAPLHHAIKSTIAHNDIIKILIEKGAEIDVIDSHKRTPLHRAAQFGHLETVKLLLDYGANPLVLDEKGQTPADRAFEYPKIVTLLKNYTKNH